MTRRSCAWQLAFLLLTVGDARAQFFTGLGDLPGGATSSKAYGVSADGRTVVGVSGTAATSQQPFRWTQSGGMQGLGLMQGAGYASCNAISSDGSTIVGGMRSQVSDIPSQAYRWTLANGYEGLGVLEAGAISEAFGVSADGSVVAGMDSLTGGQAFRWTESDGMEPLGFLPGGSFSISQGVSDDGQVVVGYGDSSNTTHETGKDEAFRWTASDGLLHSLGDLSGGPFNSRAFAVSGDGLVAVGESDSAAGTDAFRYVASIESLGDFNATAFAASMDGSVIVGGAIFKNGGSEEAFVWDATNGLRRLADVLSGTASLAKWTLGPARGVSADGNTIVGTGVDPAGHTEAWLARLPEPDTALLQGCALVALALLAARRARSRLARL